MGNNLNQMVFKLQADIETLLTLTESENETETAETGNENGYGREPRDIR